MFGRLPIELINTICINLPLRDLGILAQINYLFYELITNDGYYIKCKKIYYEYCKKNRCEYEFNCGSEAEITTISLLKNSLDKKKVNLEYVTELTVNFNYFTRFVHTHQDDLVLETFFPYICGNGKLDVAKLIVEIFPSEIKKSDVIWQALLNSVEFDDVSEWICKEFAIEIFTYMRNDFCMLDLLPPQARNKLLSLSPWVFNKLFGENFCNALKKIVDAQKQSLRKKIVTMQKLQKPLEMSID